jgi:drug/metabolite transporter (DMT)-like permease
MIKLILILLVALAFEAIGVVYLSKGLKEIPKPDRVSLAAGVALVRAGFVNPRLWVGVAFEAVFFCGLLILMSRADVSFVWPLTSLGFVFTTVAAKLVLGEEIDGTRWAGVMLIVLGVGFISWSEKVKRDRHPGAAHAASASMAGLK